MKYSFNNNYKNYNEKLIFYSFNFSLIQLDFLTFFIYICIMLKYNK